jgi:hypothetical protein
LTTSLTKRFEVHRHPRFEGEVARRRPDTPGLDAALRGFEVVIAALAEYGYTVPGVPDYRLWPIHPPGGSFKIIYKIRGSRVLLLSLYPVPSSLFGR